MLIRVEARQVSKPCAHTVASQNCKLRLTPRRLSPPGTNTEDERAAHDTDIGASVLDQTAILVLLGVLQPAQRAQCCCDHPPAAVSTPDIEPLQGTLAHRLVDGGAAGTAAARVAPLVGLSPLPVGGWLEWG